MKHIKSTACVKYDVIGYITPVLSVLLFYKDKSLIGCASL